MTTIVPVVLSPTVTVANAAATTYITGAANAQTIIKQAVLTNFTGGAITFDLWRVASGGTASNANLLIHTRSIAAAPATDLLPELKNEVLNAGDTIQIQASAGTSLNFTASGYVFTA